MINKQQAMEAKRGDIFYHRTMRNRDGTPLRVRVTGKCQTWKKRPDDFRLPVKHGLKDSGEINAGNSHDWCISEAAVVAEADYHQQEELPDVRTGIKQLLHETVVSVTGADVDSEEIEFVTQSGKRFHMYHSQNCCESVQVQDIVGDINDLLHTPITRAEANEQNDPNASESGMWTFYKLDTYKGGVTIRWYGSSNGYYSERVDFEKR